MIGGDARVYFGNDRLKMANICGLPTGHEDELELIKADSLDDGTRPEAIVAYLGKGMPPREIINSSQGGNNALEDVVQGLAAWPSRCAAIARR